MPLRPELLSPPQQIAAYAAFVAHKRALEAAQRARAAYLALPSDAALNAANEAVGRANEAGRAYQLAKTP